MSSLEQKLTFNTGRGHVVVGSLLFQWMRTLACCFVHTGMVVADALVSTCIWLAGEATGFMETANYQTKKLSLRELLLKNNEN